MLPAFDSSEVVVVVRFIGKGNGSGLGVICVPEISFARSEDINFSILVSVAGGIS